MHFESLMRTTLALITFAALGLASLGSVGRCAEGTAAADVAVLRLSAEAYAAGQLVPSDDPKVLRWQSPAFARPLDFRVEAVQGVYFPASDKATPGGEYRFELSGGDVLYGTLVGLTAEEAVVESTVVGKLRLRRECLLSMHRVGSADLVYNGPSGLAGWTEIGPEKAWREEAGQSVADRNGTLFGDVGLPAKAIVELELSWPEAPDFAATLGASEKSTLGRAFGIEVWQRSLVAVRETPSAVDATVIEKLGDGPGRVRLVVYVDQDAGRMLVFSATGAPAADLSLPPQKPQPLSGIAIANRGAGLRLERLRVSHWDGAPPREVQADKPRVHGADGNIVYGEIKEFDAAAKQFVVAGDGGTTRIAGDAVASLVFRSSDSASTGILRAIYRDGTQLSGELVGVGADYVQLAVANAAESVKLPWQGLRSLVARKPPVMAAVSAPGRPGVLEANGLRLPGRLADAKQQADASGLAWLADGCTTACALRMSASGRIDLREPRTIEPPKPWRPPTWKSEFVGWIAKTLANEPAAAEKGWRKSLHLRSGDVIPCDVSRITEEGVALSSPFSTATFIPAAKVKAVELVTAESPPKLDKTKRERMLTVPRLQRDSPPTHLVRSPSGDFLRGRLQELDAKKLLIEVRADVREIPRDRVSHVIWLHADESSDGKPAAAADSPSQDDAPAAAPEANSSQALPIQVRRSDGNRLTFHPVELSGGVISGKSDVLGECRAEVAQIDEILLGESVAQAAETVAYRRWTLRKAIDPKFAQDPPNPNAAGADAPLPGTESELVGKPAPDFELALLDGKSFRLSQNRGRIVVLDFWATWCGPCLQAMPKVDAVVREFQDAKVDLVAVNLEEPANQIESTLERHKLQMSVALDRDGVVAARYDAISIPYTVLVGRDGQVARVFVGNSPKLADQIRDALRMLSAE